MRQLYLIIMVLAFNWICAQSNTEVYLVDLTTSGEQLTFQNLRNISNNDGYDNQPSFYGDDTILFTATRNGQTDIAKYDIKKTSTSWITNTPGGSEYSPIRIPNSTYFSAIRLDSSGLQRLYRHDVSTGKSTELLKNLKVGYHVWYNENILITTVLVENRMDLVITNLKKGTTNTVQENVGRSLHLIPNTNLISYIGNENKNGTVKSVDPVSLDTQTIIPLPPETQDVCWLPNGSLLTGLGKSILKFNPETDKKWLEIKRFSENEINAISRLAVSPSGNKISIVSEMAPETIVQKQVVSFNSGDLDAFVSCYTENVLVQNFPSDTLYTGRSTMKKKYTRFLANNPDTSVKVVNRISIGNKVIDEEMATVGGKTHQQVALYEIANGLISSMTFIFPKGDPIKTEAIVQKQLDAYNSRDIDAFVDTYSKDIKVYNFPNKLSFEGQEKMRDSYGGFFESTPDLNCQIKKRIVIGNKVIDEEYLTINGKNYSAVAIYEVENGKISKVTFVR